MSAVHGNKMAGPLLAMFASESVSAQQMTALAERCADYRMRARLMVLAAFCRAHASRLLARAKGLSVRIAPVVEVYRAPALDLAADLRDASRFADAMGERYADYAEQARQQSDLSSAWVFELNRSEEQDRGRELLALASAVNAGQGQAPGPTEVQAARG